MNDEIEVLVARALAWADQDCDPADADQCRDMAARGELTELRDHFAGQLEFGTAGLRAKVGPGPWRMNRATVRRATRAVAEQLILTRPDGRPTVVVAFDGRESSCRLAAEACGTLAAAGVDVLAFPEPVPTPLAAFALLRESADAGIVITASHNPKEYNGYKLYGPEGAQIVSPTDQQIAERLVRLGAAKDIPWEPFTGDARDVEFSQYTEAAYFAALRQLCGSKPRRIRIAYTPLHGLGAVYVERALNEAGFSEVCVVAEQRDPHPRFPTVPFPNPEEAGVMQRLFTLAEQQHADVALANDPDVDRLAVGVAGEGGRFEALTGNQVGALLADYLLTKYAEAGAALQPLVVQSVVSTPMVGAICAAQGARWERTLTGFKWISRPAIALAGQVALVLGFEEAIGYATLRDVRDKDGISAALVFAELADQCAVQGSTLPGRLLHLYQQHGLWVSHQHSVHLPGAAGVEEIIGAMARLRQEPPTALTNLAVSAVKDYAVGAEVRPAWLPEANLVEIALGNAGRLLVRPSGTEPKLKIYVDVCGAAPASVGELSAAERNGRQLAVSLAEDLVRQLALS